MVSKLEHDRVKTKVEKLEAAIEEERKERRRRKRRRGRKRKGRVGKEE